MKQIPLLQGKALLIEIPEGAKDLDIFKAHYGQQLMYTDKFDYGATFDLPEGNWRIIGMLSEVTESDASGLVESDTQYGTVMYRNYKTTSMTYYDEQITALESFHSAIRASGWLLENTYPIINDPKFYDEPYDGSGFYQELYSGALDDWKQRQSRTLNPELTLILERK